MESIRIDIINPKAKRIIKDLAALDLINIRSQDPIKSFQSLLKKLRKNSASISLQEITKEVELVRARKDVKKS